MHLQTSGAQRSPPLLISSDLLHAYTTERLRHGAWDALSTCAQLLDLWRQNTWPIAHLRTIPGRPSTVATVAANERTDDLKPRPSELIFEHVLPSAYSSARYTDYMRSMPDTLCILIGFSLDETILATAIDGFHRSHRYQLVPEAIICRKPRTCHASEYRKAALEIAESYVDFIKVFEILNLPSGSRAYSQG